VTNLDLQLKPALTITGRVEDPQGEPISNAEAHVYLHSGEWGFPVYWQPVTTDALGRFKIASLPADRTYYINFGAKGYGSSQEKVPTEDGNVIELPPVIVKKADLKLLGQVVDSSGTPLAKASINVNGNGQPNLDVQADANGRFALEVCPGTVSLYVRFQELQTSAQAQAGDSQRPPAKPEACRRWSGSKPHGPSGGSSTLAMSHAPCVFVRPLPIFSPSRAAIAEPFRRLQGGCSASALRGP
jgi:hypothetical protein